MPFWFEDDEQIEALRVKANERVIATEIEHRAAQSVLSQIENALVRRYLRNVCNVGVGRGICMFSYYGQTPIHCVIEEIRPIDCWDHVEIAFRRITKKGALSKVVETVRFDQLKYFTKAQAQTGSVKHVDKSKDRSD